VTLRCAELCAESRRVSDTEPDCFSLESEADAKSIETQADTPDTQLARMMALQGKFTHPRALHSFEC
jgi:hypothetical protein